MWNLASDYLILWMTWAPGGSAISLPTLCCVSDSNSVAIAALYSFESGKAVASLWVGESLHIEEVPMCKPMKFPRRSGDLTCRLHLVLTTETSGSNKSGRSGEGGAEELAENEGVTNTANKDI
ncbi:hypothetical protein CROQUDRAFT_292649 [Cronartium quercuum f. sp. fusiforme G11]|uniref:Secreted protein n=1 Tax=Cronartium quercuum f. sp. fusiforme G11 TaxID=708437 RepID=A0A9P6NCB3_9BASI|nr:hypothetical protein CROQUDRAFT_292649 [Cronartium quercuum f. sp. fusiforme G11]